MRSIALSVGYLRGAMAALAFVLGASGVSAAHEVVVYGPKTYAPPPGLRMDEFALPAGARGPFRMQVRNGGPQASSRLRFAWVFVNGALVAEPADFAQPFFEKDVPLRPSNRVVVVMLGRRGVFFEATFFGRSVETVPIRLLPSPLPITLGAHGELTATLSPPPPSAGDLGLTSSDPGVALVPESIPFAAGQTEVVVSVEGRSVGTSLVTASLGGGSATASVRVTPVPPAVVALEPSRAAVSVGGSGSLSGRLSSAPAHDTEVQVSTSDPGVVAAPPFVTVPAGRVQAEFAFTGLAEGRARITASLDGSSASSEVTVTEAPPTVVSLVPAVSTILLDSSTTLEVTISASQPGPTELAIAVTTSRIVSVPASLIVPPGERSARLPVLGAALGQAGITATLNGSSASALVDVVSPPLAIVSLLPERVAIATGATASFRVRINAVQPGPVEVAVDSSHPAVLEVPGVVVVPPGEVEAVFEVLGLARGEALVTASVNGTSRTSRARVTPEPAAVASLLPSPLPLQEGATGLLTLALNVAQESDTLVALSNDAPSVAEVAASLTVLAGQLSATVPVTGLAEGEAAVSASVNGTSATARIVVTPPPPVVTGVRPARLVLAKGTSGVLRVVVSRAPLTPTVVSLESDAPGVAAVPAEVTVPAGELGADFPVATLAVGEATLTATLNGASASAQVSVAPAEPAFLVVSPAAPTAFVGDAVAFTALATMSDGAVQAVSATWSSSEMAVASIDAMGMAQLHAPGETLIGARHEFTTAGGLPTTISASTLLSARLRPSLSLSGAATDLTLRQAVEVTLGSTEAAPSGGLEVALAASGTGAATFPASVRLDAGATTATFTLTATARGTLTLTASAPGRTSASLAFTIREGPHVLSVEPPSAPVGATVRLIGGGFDAAASGNTVRFAGSPGTVPAVVLSASESELTVRVPPLAESGPIQVTTAGGSAASPPFTVVREQDFQIVVSPAGLLLYPGAGGAAQLQLASTGTQPFTGLVALSVESVPAGVTAAFVPAASLSASRIAALHLSSSAAAPGSYAIVVRGRFRESGQLLERTASLELQVQAPDGVTGARGRFVTPEKVGVPGVIVRADASPNPVQTVSDAAGNFQLVGLPAGPVTLRFDATPANPLYPIWPYTTTLPAGQVTEFVDWTINPPPDADKFTPIANGTQTQVITDARFPGLEIRLPAGATIIGWDGVPKSRIAVERVEVTSLPVPPPPTPTGAAYQLYFGTPMGGIPSMPIPVTLPNDVAAEPGESVDVWFFDGSPMGGSGEWKIAGAAIVVPDGRTARMPDGTGIPRFCGVCGLTCLGKQKPAPVEPIDPCKYGNPVEPFTGQELPDTGGLRCSGLTPIETGMSYNPVDAFDNIGGIVGSMGFGWVLDYDIAFLPFVGPQKRLVLPGNRRVNFVDDGSGAYRPFDDPRFEGAVFRATNEAAGEWELTLRDRGRWFFQPFGQASIRGGRPTFVTEMIDPQGNVLRIDRQSNGRIRSIGNSDRGVSMAYGPNGFVSEIKDSADRVMKYTYTSNARLETATDPDGRVTRYTYVGDAEFAVPPVCDPQPSFGLRLKTIEYPGRPVPTENFYGPGRRVLRQTGYDGREHRFAYRVTGACVTHVSSPATRCTGAGCPDVDSWESFEAGWRLHGGTVVATTITRPNGRKVSHEFNARGMTTARTDAQGQRTSTERDARSRVTRRTDVLGRTWTYAYDDNGNVLQERDPLDRLATYTYDPAWNKVTSLTRMDDLGQPQTWRFTYDPVQGTVRSVVDPLDQTTSFDYTSRGQLERVTTPRSKVMRLEYDETGDLRKLVDPLGHETRFGYDGVGRQVVKTDPLSYVSRTAYDGQDAITRLTDARGKVTRLGHDAAGRLFEVRNARDVLIESYGYDSGDRLRSRTDALGRETGYDYDQAGRLETETDRRGRVTTYAYDEEDRLVSITRPEGVTHSAYDAADRLTEVSDPASTVTYRYDPVDRVVGETIVTDGLRTESTYGYDALDRRVSRSVAGLPGEGTTYGYDLANRLRSITSRGGTTSFDYDAAGRLRVKTLPNGIRQELSWDDADRLSGIVYKDPADAVITSIAYAYDANGRRIEQTGPAALGETAFTANYDDADRMTGFTLSGTGQTFALAYDDEGNLATRTDVADSSNVTTYTWDSQNQLVGLIGPGLEASFAYDAFGRRIRKTVNGERVEYVYDGLQAIGEVADGSVTGLLTGPGLDEVLARYAGAGERFYLTDALGSVIVQTAPDRSIQSTYAYSPYGETSAQGADGGNAIQYTARENDSTGLYYYRARYYDPLLKRFTQADPIGLAGGINTYAYVGGDPVSNIDPTGLWSMGFEGYAGWGGGFKFGVDPKTNQSFFCVRLGIGKGGGPSWEPLGERPRVGVRFDGSGPHNRWVR